MPSSSAPGRPAEPPQGGGGHDSATARPRPAATAEPRRPAAGLPHHAARAIAEPPAAGQVEPPAAGLVGRPAAGASGYPAGLPEHLVVVLEEYRRHLRSERGRSPHTV